MVNVEIVVGIIALGVIGAVFIPIAFDPKGEFDLIQCEEGEIITFDSEGNAICDTVVPVGDGRGSFANENTEFRPHLVQGTNVQDPIVNFDDYQIRVLEYLPTQDGQTSWDYLVPEQYESGEDLQWTLYWFKEDGLPDLSVVPHYYEEVTTCGETSTTAEIITIQDGVEFDFEEDETYLIMANTMWGGTSESDLYQIDVRHGDTTFKGSRMISEPNDAGTSPCSIGEDVYKYFWWTVWTPNATEATQNLSIHATSGLGLVTPQQFVQETSDDAEQLVASPFTMALTTTDIDIHDGGSAFDGHASWRYTGVPIEQGATILNAEMQFEVEETGHPEDDDPLTIDFTGHDIGDSPVHTTTAGNISDRVQTSANVTWNIPDWDSVGDRGSAQLTPDLSTIVQEIVDRGDWVSGNDMTIMNIDPPDDQGHRHAESDSDFDPAELTIDYLGVTPSSPMLYDDVTFTVIKLSEHFVEDEDYFFDIDTTSTELSASPFWNTPNSASVTFTPENNDDDWLVLGTASYFEGSGTFSDSMRTRLNVAGAETDLPLISYESEDTAELQIHSFARPLILENTTQTLTIESQISSPRSTENRTSNSVFALNLDLFTEHDEIWIESAIGLSESTHGTQVADVQITPSTTKDTVIISDIGFQDATANIEARVQDNNSDTLPDQSINDYDFNEQADGSDISRWTLVTVESLDDSFHDLETDASDSAETSPDAIYRSMIAFTLEAREIPSPIPLTACMFLELMSVAVGEDLSSLVVPTFDTPKEVCVTTAGGADILRTFTWNYNTTEIPFSAEEVGIVKLSRNFNNTNEDFNGTVFGLFGELQWVYDP